MHSGGGGRYGLGGLRGQASNHNEAPTHAHCVARPQRVRSAFADWVRELRNAAFVAQITSTVTLACHVPLPGWPDRHQDDLEGDGGAADEGGHDPGVEHHSREEQPQAEGHHGRPQDVLHVVWGPGDGKQLQQKRREDEQIMGNIFFIF